MIFGHLRTVVFGSFVGRVGCAHYRRASRLTFPVINGDIDANSSEFNKKRDSYSEFTEKYIKHVTSLDSGISQKAIDRHVKVNKKLLVKNRLSHILDPESDFLEISPLAGLGLEYGDVFRAGTVSGIGWISGQAVVIQANDATVKGGTAYPITVKKQLRAQEIAEENNLPCLYLIDSGGAFLPLQADIFPDEQHGGRVFYNEAVMSSKNIPQICVVCGSCTAGAAYIPTMADRTVIVHRIGTIFLGGPPLVQAATGEMVTAEDLGGATVHSSVSGCTDYFADTEEEAFSITRDIFASLNPGFLSFLGQQDYEDPLYNPDELGPLSVHDDKQILPIRKIIARIVDGSMFHEFKSKFGPTLITGFAFIKGVMVGILANQGPFTPAAAAKGAHFIQLCCQQNTPLIFMQDTYPDMKDKTGLVKDLSKMIAVIACAKVPKITVVLGRSFGPSSYAMCSRSLQPSFMYLWPTAEIALDTTDKLIHLSVMEGDGEEKRTKLGKRLRTQSSAFYSTARVWDDGIILPHQTREVLGLSLKASLEKRERSESHSYPVIRM